MATRDQLPEPWRSALEPKGVTTKRGLATRVGVSPQTAKRLIDGMGRPSPETVAAVADALFNGDRDKVWSLAGLAHTDHGDFQLPAEASLLDPEQREAVLAVVRAMLPASARHLSPSATAESKAERRARTEPTVAAVTAAQRTHLQAVESPAAREVMQNSVDAALNQDGHIDIKLPGRRKAEAARTTERLSRKQRAQRADAAVDEDVNQDTDPSDLGER